MYLLGALGITEILIILIMIIPLLICSFICGNIAEKKNRDIGTWRFIGFFLGLLGILIIVLLKPAVSWEENKNKN